MINLTVSSSQFQGKILYFLERMRTLPLVEENNVKTKGHNRKAMKCHVKCELFHNYCLVLI